GSFYAHYLTFMGPTACEVKLSILLVIMVTVGGMGHVWGAVIGTVIMTAIPEWLGSLEEMGLLMQDMDFLVYGIIMMVILMFMPDGLYGGLEKGTGLLRRLWPKGGVDHGSTA
ncbi:MAG: branched-chain amino acid ABC transporter permease, partial [bacterium]|nr:branched-chain amino acid ABC transporter permease [bacterium]